MSRVFISYVREISDTTQRLVQVLEARGVDVWFDRTHLLPGARWADGCGCRQANTPLDKASVR